MKIIIKNLKNEIIYETNADSLAEALIEAVAENISFRDADFRNADFSSANFSSANFRYILGDGVVFKTLILDGHHIAITKNDMAIGCEQHSHEEWLNFSEKEIFKIDRNKARDFWVKWKDFIFHAININKGSIK